MNEQRINRTWSIGLDQWILEDGNYNGGFEVGKDYQFAIKFYLNDFEVIPAESPSPLSASKLDSEPNTYAIVAPIVYKDEQIFMLDLGGIIAYDECPPSDRLPPAQFAARAKILELKVGDIIQANMHLGIDYYLYFEIHCFRARVPPIIYSWHIDSIEYITAKLMLDPKSPHPKSYCVDPSTVLWRQTINTFWVPGPQPRGYILHCTAQDVPPVGKDHSIPLE